ncbi:hypothetical protein Patl1_36229 [Pistacia atlantica]|nr:hypothetical protein Patl1_36229 [Pistacia atlantica]
MPNSVKHIQASGCFYFLILFSSFSIISHALTDAEASFIARRQLLTLPKDGKLPIPEFEIGLDKQFENDRLKKAYVGLHAFKKAIYSDPFNTTGNWVGPDVCSYTGVFCTPASDDPKIRVVSGIDLNHADIAGYFPAELGLLTDLVLFHINTNSNNRFVGPFPKVVLYWKKLKYLDIRFNDFEGELPPEVFELPVDVFFINNNRFSSCIPDTIGKSNVSVVVFAHNRFSGSIPTNLTKMKNLAEILLIDNQLGGCLPQEFGELCNLTVFDVTFNNLSGSLPKSFKELKNLQILDLSHNQLIGNVSEEICKLPKLSNFTFNDNYFEGVSKECSSGKNFVMNDTNNCLADRPEQRMPNICSVNRNVDCSAIYERCGGSVSPPFHTPVPKPTAPTVPSPDPHKQSPVKPAKPIPPTSDPQPSKPVAPQPPKQAPLPPPPTNQWWPWTPKPPTQAPPKPSSPIPQPPKQSTPGATITKARG